MANQGSERDPDQWWFWTGDWQAGEREADADIAAGRVTAFAGVEEFDAYAREVVADDGEHLPHSA